MNAAGGWCAPPETVYDPAPGIPGPLLAAAEEDMPRLPFGGMKYAPVAEPVAFPPPRSEDVAQRIEATAEQIKTGFPYRSLLDCRQLAERLVDEVLTWDAMWPEAEGDYPFCCDYCEHNASGQCGCQPCTFIRTQTGFQHAPDCWWVASQ